MGKHAELIALIIRNGDIPFLPLGGAKPTHFIAHVRTDVSSCVASPSKANNRGHHSK